MAPRSIAGCLLAWLALSIALSTPAESTPADDGLAAAADTDDARFQALLPRRGTEPPCWLVLFVQIEATGFNTIREHFASLSAVETFRKGTVDFRRRSSLVRARAARPALPLGQCSPHASSWFGGREPCTWDQLLDELNRGPRHHRRVLVELPTMAMAAGAPSRRSQLEQLLSAARRLRRVWTAGGCAVVLATILRDPLAHLAALFSRVVRPEQLRAPDEHGRDFAEWVHSAHVHNPSARLLIGEPVLSLRANPGSGFRRLPAMYATTPADVHARLPQLLEALGSFDLVAPLSAFDELFFLLAERIGLRRRRYTLRSPAPGAASAANLSGVGLGRAPSRAPEPGAPLQERAVRANELDWDMRGWLASRKLSADRILYSNVSRAWERAIAALSPGTRTRMKLYKALMRIARREDARAAAAAASTSSAVPTGPNATHAAR